MDYVNFKGEYIENRYYPIIFERESNSIINAPVVLNEDIESNIGQSFQNQFIYRSGTSGNYGKKKATVGIRPMQTAYDLGGYDTFKTKFKSPYSSMLLSKGNSTSYFIATRCTSISVTGCSFNVFKINQGYLTTHMLCSSDESGVPIEPYSEIFPVVIVDGKLIEKYNNSCNFVIR